MAPSPQICIALHFFLLFNSGESLLKAITEFIYMEICQMRKTQHGAVRHLGFEEKIKKSCVYSPESRWTEEALRSAGNLAIW